MKVVLIVSIFLAWISLAFSGMKMRTSDKEAQAEFAKHEIGLVVKDLNYQGNKLHYVKVGSDSLPTLFFLHGSPGSWNAFKSYLLDSDLRKKFRMIAIDRPGFGYSDFGCSMSLYQQGLLISKCIQCELNNKPFHLIGHSIGGPVVIQLAQLHPLYYSSLVILAGSISPYLEPKEPLRHIFNFGPLKILLPGAFRPSNREIISFKKDLFLLDKNYSNLKMPILFIHGNKDPLVSVDNVAYGFQKLKENSNVKKVIIDGANHFIPWEHFDTIKAQLLLLKTEN